MAAEAVPQLRLSGDPLIDVLLLILANLALAGVAFYRGRHGKSEGKKKDRRVIVIKADNLRIFEILDGRTDEASHGSGGQQGDKVS